MKLLLICSAGTSTSLLVQKMIEEAKVQNKDYIIEAMGSSEAKLNHDKFDVFLLGPQVGFMKKGLEELVAPKPLDKIPPLMYGRLDAKGVIEFAENLAKK